MGESTPRCRNLQRSLAGKLSIICKTAQSADDCAVFFIVASAASLTSGETLFAGGKASFSSVFSDETLFTGVQELSLS